MRVSLFVAGLLCVAAFGAPKAVEAHGFTYWLGNSQLVVEGGRALNRGDIARAIDLTRRALEIDLTFNDEFSAYNNLCVAYSSLSLFDIALDYCDRALSMRNDWRALNNRANAKLGMGKIDEAIKDYRTALSMKPNAKVLQSNLALALERKKLGLPATVPKRSGV
ncbi:MAG: tetratricopeptide repeat protein [Sphingomonadales bacterium]